VRDKSRERKRPASTESGFRFQVSGFSEAAGGRDKSRERKRPASTESGFRFQVSGFSEAAGVRKSPGREDGGAPKARIRYQVSGFSEAAGEGKQFFAPWRILSAFAISSSGARSQVTGLRCQ
jgi:hypothetical protein